MVIILVMLFIYAFSGLGWLYFAQMTSGTNMLRVVLDKKLILNIGIGFSVSYSIYCLFYFLIIFAINNNQLEAAASSILVVGGLGISFLSYYAYKIWASKSPEYQFSNKITKALLGLILVSIIIVIPQLVLGSKPFLASDSWSHISIINRLLDSGNLTLSSFSMPSDNYVLRYSPHHSFLSAIALLSGASALEIFTAARVFYPIILMAAFLSFLNNLDESILKKSASMIIAIIIFALIFPTTDGVWRGSADYRMPAFILMFVVLRVAYPIVSAQVNLTTFSALTVFGLSLAIAVTHAIEIALITLILVPLGLLVAYKKKSKIIFGYLIGAFVSFIICGVIGLLLSRGYNVPLKKSVEYIDFIFYYIKQLDTHIAIYTWFVSALLVIINRQIIIRSKSSLILFFKCTLFSSLVLGPLNPILFPLYNNIMGSSHSNRIMYVFPFYLVLIYFSSHILNELKSPSSQNRKFILYGSVFLIISAVAVNFYQRAGLNGDFTYKSSDRLSQLNLYPSFYKTLKFGYQHKVIISDTFISAPINAVTNNYVFTHRPWTGGVENRFQLAKEIMSNPISADSMRSICKYKIDLLAINESTPPKEYLNLFSEAPWLIADFKLKIQLNDIKQSKGYSFVGNLDGIELFEVNRGLLCE